MLVLALRMSAGPSSSAQANSCCLINDQQQLSCPLTLMFFLSRQHNKLLATFKH